jgi:hypothetical protein
MQFYGISFMRPYRQSGRWQDVFDQAYHKTAYTSLPEEGTLGCSKHVEDAIFKLKL